MYFQPLNHTLLWYVSSIFTKLLLKEVEGWKKIYYAEYNQKKYEIAILRMYHFKAKNIARD
jgi:hypothetical protein